MPRIADVTLKGPAVCGLLCVLLFAACASTPRTNLPLRDESEHTDYELDAVAGRLSEAENMARQGHRGLASAIYDAAYEVLTEQAPRERQYVRCLQAAMWGGHGEGRDEDRARALLPSALPGQDQRLAADIELARAVIECGGGNFEAAEEFAASAFLRLAEIRAYGLIVESHLGLADGFSRCGEPERAANHARKALELSRRMSDDVLIPAATEAAAFLPAPEREQALRLAYEACYRENDAGWRAAVIATAVKLYFEDEDWQACIAWGDRIRSRDAGVFPLGEDSGLYVEDLFELIARYALARVNSGAEPRRTLQSLQDAMTVYADLEDDSREEFAVLAENLERAILQRHTD